MADIMRRQHRQLRWHVVGDRTCDQGYNLDPIRIGSAAGSRGTRSGRADRLVPAAAPPGSRVTRGRLINAILAEIAQLDVIATAADPDGPGPRTGGFDPDFQETTAQTPRRELPAVRIPCQVEVQAFGELQELATGNSPRSQVVLVFHFADLEALGLVDQATGDALVRTGDRLVALRDVGTGTVIQAIRTPPGLYVTEAQPVFGLGQRRNLLLVTFHERALGARAAGG
jgi:hypothetical protein